MRAIHEVEINNYFGGFDQDVETRLLMLNVESSFNKKVWINSRFKECNGLYPEDEVLLEGQEVGQSGMVCFLVQVGAEDDVDIDPIMLMKPEKDSVWLLRWSDIDNQLYGVRLNWEEGDLLADEVAYFCCLPEWCLEMVDEGWNPDLVGLARSLGW